jgi:hypothetical protein
MLGKKEQEVFQLQSANKKLQLQLQFTKDSIHTQLNASIHDFQSYIDHISIKLGFADAEIRRLKKKLQFVPFNNEVKLRVDLDHLRQSGSGPDAYFTFVHDFKRLVNRLTQISETEQMLYFINGLQRYTQSRVQEFCPTTLEECITELPQLNEINLDTTNPLRKSLPTAILLLNVHFLPVLMLILLLYLQLAPLQNLL